MSTNTTPISNRSRDNQLLPAEMLCKGYSLCEAFGCRFVIAPPAGDESTPPISFCGKHDSPSFCQLNLVCGAIVRDGLLCADPAQQQPHALDLFRLVVNSFQYSNPTTLPFTDADRPSI